MDKYTESDHAEWTLKKVKSNFYLLKTIIFQQFS